MAEDAGQHGHEPPIRLLRPNRGSTSPPGCWPATDDPPVHNGAPAVHPHGCVHPEMVATVPSLLCNNKKPGMKSTTTRATPGQRDFALCCGLQCPLWQSSSHGVPSGFSSLQVTWIVGAVPNSSLQFSADGDQLVPWPCSSPWTTDFPVSSGSATSKNLV